MTSICLNKHYIHAADAKVNISMLRGYQATICLKLFNKALKSSWVKKYLDPEAVYFL